MAVWVSFALQLCFAVLMIAAQSTLPNCKLLESSRGMYMRYLGTSSNLTVEVTAKTTGWVGIGFHGNSGLDTMGPGDFVIGWFGSDQKSYVNVYTKQSGSGFPNILVTSTPALQAALLSNVSLTRNNGFLTMRFTRPLSAGINFTVPLQSGTKVRLLYAFKDDHDSTSTTLSQANYHGTNRWQVNDWDWFAADGSRCIVPYTSCSSLNQPNTNVPLINMRWGVDSNGWTSFEIMARASFNVLGWGYVDPNGNLLSSTNVSMVIGSMSAAPLYAGAASIGTVQDVVWANPSAANGINSSTITASAAVYNLPDSMFSQALSQGQSVSTLRFTRSAFLVDTTAQALSTEYPTKVFIVAKSTTGAIPLATVTVGDTSLVPGVIIDNIADITWKCVTKAANATIDLARRPSPTLFSFTQGSDVLFRVPLQQRLVLLRNKAAFAANCNLTGATALAREQYGGGDALLGTNFRYFFDYRGSFFFAVLNTLASACSFSFEVDVGLPGSCTVFPASLSVGNGSVSRTPAFANGVAQGQITNLPAGSTGIQIGILSNGTVTYTTRVQQQLPSVGYTVTVSAKDNDPCLQTRSGRIVVSFTKEGATGATNNYQFPEQFDSYTFSFSYP